MAMVVDCPLSSCRSWEQKCTPVGDSADNAAALQNLGPCGAYDSALAMLNRRAMGIAIRRQTWGLTL